MNRLILFALLLVSLSLKLGAQGTAFNYQGRLNDGGVPANASYDIRFAVYDAVTNGSRVSVLVTNSAVAVSNGLFSVTLDFGPGIFAGNDAWLDLAVRAVAVTNFTTLSPRQPVLPVPYAIFATGASNLLGTLSANQLVGTLPSAQVSGTYFGQVNFTNSTNTFVGTFTGNGAALTNLNATQLTFGTVADARLTTNVALLNASQTFTGSNTFSGGNNFTNRANNFTGSFFGNGLVGWVLVNNTAVTALPDTGYLLTSAQLTTVTLPSLPIVGDIVRISGAGAGGWRVGPGTNQSIVGNFFSYRNGLLQPSSTTGDWRRLCASADGSRMYAGGNLAGGVYLSADFGQTWNSTGISGSGWFSVACSADGTKVYAAPNGAAILTSANGGTTWIAFGSVANWTAIACSADATRYVAGAASGALTGNIATSPASGNYTAVACSANATNIAAAIGTTVYASTNAGATWGSTTMPGVCSALVAAAGGSKLVAAYNGGISTSTNFGTSWTVSGAGAGAWTCLAGSSDCTRLVAGISNSLFYASANFGATWTAVGTANKWSGAAISADGSKFIGAVRTVGSTVGALYYSGIDVQPSLTTTNAIYGSQGSAVELQYIGNNQFMPVSAVGTLWTY